MIIFRTYAIMIIITIINIAITMMIFIIITITMAITIFNLLQSLQTLNEHDFGFRWKWSTKCVHGLHAISTFHFLQSINPNKIQRLSNTNYIMYIYMYIMYISLYIYTPIYWIHVSVRWNLYHVRNTKAPKAFGTSEGFTVRFWWGPSARRPAANLS